MRLLISGESRSGTCWLGEIIKAAQIFNFSSYIEDRDLHKRQFMCKSYATKLTTNNDLLFLKPQNINQLIANYPDLYILFSVRHPVNLVMAKTANKDTEISEVASRQPYQSVYIHITAVKNMYAIYKRLKIKYTDRIFYTKLEDRITDTKKAIKNICEILNIEFKIAMVNAHSNTMNAYHQKRYGPKIDKTQANIYQNWQTAYDGYFKDKKDIIDIIKTELYNLPDYFNYKIKDKYA